MSRPENGDRKASRKPAPKNPWLGWIIRGVVFGVLAILLALALLDFSARQAAQGTADAWRAAKNAKDETAELWKSEFEAIPVKGRPAVATDKAEPNSFAATTVSTYTWKGTFRTYTVKVYFGLGKDPAVEQIDGPGESK